MKINALFRSPKITGGALAFISLAAGAIVLEAADFGASGWILAPLLLWLATLGLPTTAAVLSLAALWGRVSPFYGFWFFCLVAVMLAVGSQVLAVRALAQLARRSV